MINEETVSEFQMRTSLPSVIALLVLVTVVSMMPHIGSSGINVKRPLLIHQGQVQSIGEQALTGSYWFQVGASGDSSSSSHYGASVAIRTVYDQANNDAHSYWVGGYLSNSAFIQVGYLTTLSTDGRPYCCAWFYEYFPSQSSPCCPPMIGPEFSAGPIGSWHSYKMDSNLNGTWSFYMDDKLLSLPSGNASGTTPNLGTNNSGTYPPAALAEVADASNARDTLGPAEFSNLTYRRSIQPTDWQPVPKGQALVTYGAPSKRDLLNPYGSVEITGVDNNFLAGSHLPQTATNTLFWPAAPLLNVVTFEFLDTSGKIFLPDWISLYQSGTPSTRVYYTRYSAQSIDPAMWILDTAMWHNSDISPQNPRPSVNTQSSNQMLVNGKVFPLTIHVVGYLLPYPIAGAKVYTNYPDSVPINATADQNGNVTFGQVPPGNYSIRAVAPRGLQSTLHSQITDVTSLTIRVFGLPEELTLLIVPVAAAIIIVAVAFRKERARKRMWESMTTPPPVQPPNPAAPTVGP